MPEILNIGAKSDDPRVAHLTNFSADGFSLDGIWLASVEGFIQGIKFPQGDPRRQKAFASVGFTAKRLGRKAEGHEFVWWRNEGDAIPFGSPEHHALIERAIRAKFAQNKEAMDALLATAGMALTHDLGRPESPNTSLPAKLFCDILMRIRATVLDAREQRCRFLALRRTP